MSAPKPVRYTFNVNDAIITPQQLLALTEADITITSVAVTSGRLHLSVDTSRHYLDVADVIWRVFPHGDCLRAANVTLYRAPSKG